MNYEVFRITASLFIAEFHWKLLREIMFDTSQYESQLNYYGNHNLVTVKVSTYRVFHKEVS